MADGFLYINSEIVYSLESPLLLSKHGISIFKFVTGGATHFVLCELLCAEKMFPVYVLLLLWELNFLGAYYNFRDRGRTSLV
jgi:hypothetical protein